MTAKTTETETGQVKITFSVGTILTIISVTIAVVGAISTFTGTVLSRPTKEAVEDMISKDIFPVQQEIKYLREHVDAELGHIRRGIDEIKEEVKK